MTVYSAVIGLTADQLNTVSRQAQRPAGSVAHISFPRKRVDWEKQGYAEALPKDSDPFSPPSGFPSSDQVIFFMYFYMID